MKRRHFCQIAGIASGTLLVPRVVRGALFSDPWLFKGLGPRLQVATSRNYLSSEILIDFAGHIGAQELASVALPSGTTYYWRAKSSIRTHYYGHFDDTRVFPEVVDMFNTLTLPFLYGLYGSSVGIDSELPLSSELGQNYPNPFRITTTIPFEVSEAGQVRLKIYNLLGQEVVTLIDDQLPAGKHTAAWHASNMASGTYVCVLKVGSFTQTRRLMLIK